MTPIFKEYVFDLSDLNLLGIVCEKCGAEMIVDVSRPAQTMPTSCASCPNDFDPNFKESLKSFQAAYTQLTEKTARASARVRVRHKITAVEF